MTTQGDLYIPGFKVSVPLSSVLFLEGELNYTTVHCEGGKSYLCCVTLKKMTADCPGFLRASKCISVNPAHVKRFENGVLYISDNHQLNTSRRRQFSLKQHLPDAYVKSAQNKDSAV